MNDFMEPNTVARSPLRQRVGILVVGSMAFVCVVVASLVVYRLGKMSGGNTGQVRDVRDYLPDKQEKSYTPSSLVPNYIQTPTPTPTPMLGPGPFACDPYGFCNAYEDSKLVGCPKTYADRFCLNECQKTNVRCPK